MKLKNKHVVITGSAKRIGRALAERFLIEGASLSVHYFSSKKEAEELSGSSKAHLFQADLSKADTLQPAINRCVEALGPIDILINSASLFFKTPAATCTEAQWDELLDANLKGQFFMATACFKHMKSGSIINIADVYGIKGLKGFAPYAASKGGLLTLTRSLAAEWAPKVRVNAINPGPILFPEDYSEAQKERSRKSTLLGREGHPNDIVEAALFLIENTYITGAMINVDGGRSLN